MLKFKIDNHYGYYYIKMIINNEDMFFSDITAFDYGINFDSFYNIVEKYYGKFKTAGIYFFPYFLSEKDAENFIELIELEMIMNKLVR